MLKDILGKIVETAVQKFGAEYAKVRAQTLYKTMLTVKEEKVKAVRKVSFTRSAEKR